MPAKPMFPFKVDAILEFPELSLYPEFGCISKNLRHFIFRFYDFALRPEKADYAEHLSRSAAEFNLTEDEHQIIRGSTECEPQQLYNYSAAVTRFLRLQDNRKWALYCACEDQFWQNIASMRTPLNPSLEDDKRERALSERAKNRGNTEDLRRLLEGYDKELFPEGDTLAPVVRKTLSRLSPEARAGRKDNE